MRRNLDLLDLLKIRLRWAEVFDRSARLDRAIGLPNPALIRVRGLAPVAEDLPQLPGLIPAACTPSGQPPTGHTRRWLHKHPDDLASEGHKLTGLCCRVSRR